MEKGHPRGFSESGLESMKRSMCRLRCAAVLLAAAALCLPDPGAAESPLSRRIGFEARGTYYVLDTGFFGLSNGLGAEAALRYELAPDIYFENAVGFFDTEGSGVSVGGFDYALSLVALFPVLIPYRPVARLGVGFLSVNPVTVTPTESFRPTQTTFYFLCGAGVSRSILDGILLEASANFWITPYQYRIYRFNRLDVDSSVERFTHLSISVAVAYTF